MSKEILIVEEGTHYMRIGKDQKVRVILFQNVKNEKDEWVDGVCYQDVKKGFNYAMSEEKFKRKFEKC